MMRKVRRPHISEALMKRINRAEVSHRGMIVAIEPRTGDYFVGETTLEALRKARRLYPAGTFVFKRIGYRWTQRQAGVLRRVRA